MRVSICVPTASASRAGFLREAIESAASQTYSNFEIVLGDNSTDPVHHAFVDRLMGEFPQLEFRLLRHPVRLLAEENFNATADAAHGDAIVFLPDDDLLCPSFLERAVAALERHPECGLTFADHWLINERSEVDVSGTDANTVRYKRDALQEGVYPHASLFHLALNQALCLQTMLIRREVMLANKFPVGVLSGDFAFGLKVSAGKTGIHAYYLKERVFKYRVHGAMISSSLQSRRSLEGLIRCMEECGTVPEACLTEYREKLGGRYLALSLSEAEAGDATASKHALQGLKLSPSIRHALVATVSVALPWTVAPIRRMRAALRRS